MTCLQCGAKEVSSRRDKYQKIGAEYDDLIINNIGGHPEPEEQVCEFKRPTMYYLQGTADTLLIHMKQD